MLGFSDYFSKERRSPGNELPNVTETIFARTAKDIIPGIEAGLNQLLAKIEGEFKIKTPPIDAKTDPKSPKMGC